MNSIHEHLRTRFSWYDEWHQGVHSNAVTWSFFLVIAIFFTFGLMRVIGEQLVFIDNDVLLAKLPSVLEKKSAEAMPDPIIERLLSLNNTALTRVNEHAKSAPGQAVAALNVLHGALTERQGVLRELAFSNPKEVRRFVFDTNALAMLPEAVRDVAEKPFRKKGTYRIYIAEVLSDIEASDASGMGFSDEVYEEYFLEVSDTERYQLALTEEEAYHFEPETEIEVSGVSFSGDIVIPDEVDSFEDDGEGEVLGATTIKKVAVIAFNFRNDTTQPLTTDTIRQRVFTNSNSIAAYYREVSYGQWDIQSRDRVDGDVYGWVTIDADATGCAYSTWASLARNALTAQGVNLTGYTNIQYVFPGSGGCSWAGLATLNGSTSWVRAQYLNTLVSGHEFGHNFGFHHASSYGCAVANSTSGACTPSEYADRHDIMGNGSARHTNNYNKSKFWIKPEQIVTVTNPGTYTISPIETNTAEVKVVRVKRPFMAGTLNFTDGYYHLEYRTRVGFDNYATTDPVVNGVSLRLVNGNYLTGGQKTYWVNTIAAGTTFTDREGGITITPIGTSTAGIVVNIEMPAKPCVRNNPSITITPSGQWGTAGNSLSYTATIKNNDTEDCGASTFTVTPTLPEGFAQLPEQIATTLNYGEQKSMSFQVSSPLSAIPASYLFSQRVTSEASTANFASASGNFNIAAADISAPVVRITSPTADSTLTARKETIEVTASDTSGVSLIEIWVDNKRLKSCANVTTCSYSWNLAKVTKGTHTLKAVAVDNSPAKNRAETTITVTK